MSWCVWCFCRINSAVKTSQYQSKLKWLQWCFFCWFSGQVWPKPGAAQSGDLASCAQWDKPPSPSKSQGSATLKDRGQSVKQKWHDSPRGPYFITEQCKCGSCDPVSSQQPLVCQSNSFQTRPLVTLRWSVTLGG